MNFQQARNFLAALALTMIFIQLLSCSPSFGATRAAVDVPRDAHGRIQRSRKAKGDFKHSNPCPATGKTSGSCPGYVIDHVIPLKRGGSDSPANMQWQTRADAKAKDKWE